MNNPYPFIINHTPPNNSERAVPPCKELTARRKAEQIKEDLHIKKLEEASFEELEELQA